MFFSCVYRHADEIHCAALRTLYLNGVVSRLGVFRATEWILLQRRGYLSLLPFEYRLMRWWDSYWRDILTEILNPVSQVTANSKMQNPS
jgi:hypothetical protein